MTSDVTGVLRHRLSSPGGGRHSTRGPREMPASLVLTAHVLCLPGTITPTVLLLKSKYCVCLLMQDVADIRQQFPSLGGDIKFPAFFKEEQFFSSVFRISSPGLQLWTHYDVRKLQNKKWKGSDICCSCGSDIHRLSIAAEGTWS